MTQLHIRRNMSMNNGLFTAFLLFPDSKDELITLVNVMYVLCIHRTVYKPLLWKSQAKKTNKKQTWVLISEYKADENCCAMSDENTLSKQKLASMNVATVWKHCSNMKSPYRVAWNDHLWPSLTKPVIIYFSTLLCTSLIGVPPTILCHIIY